MIADKYSDIILTSSLTILGGVLIYSISQILSKFIIEPIHDQRKCIGEIVDALIYYSNVTSPPPNNGPYEDPNPQRTEARDNIRKLSTKLNAKTYMIKCYTILDILRCVPKKDNIISASKKLNALSNSYGTFTRSTEIEGFRTDILKSLNVNIKI